VVKQAKSTGTRKRAKLRFSQREIERARRARPRWSLTPMPGRPSAN
jgi:hypothetical protein